MFKKSDGFSFCNPLAPVQNNNPNHNLTDDQKEGKGMILQGHSICRLMGFAGTGKSFLINDVVKEMSGRVLKTATTHKAVGVINGHSTIHSYLSLSLKTKKDKRVLEKKRFQMNIAPGDVVIIDEASTVSTELLSYVMDAVNKYGIKIIFVGDFGQIPPVGEDMSPVKEISCPSFELNKIVRQARDSNIISLATAIRNGQIKKVGFNEFKNNKDVFVGGINEMKKFFDENGHGYDYPTIISYRNKVVDNANKWARNRVRNNPTDTYLVGEKAYVRSTAECQLHKLEDVIEITSISKPFKCKSKNIPFNMNVIKVGIKSYKGEEELTVPATDIDANVYIKNKNALASKAKNKKIPWHNFWKFVESISELKLTWGMTAHRSQGSTFKNVIVNCDDITEQRLLYTACTRASEKLFILRK